MQPSGASSPHMNTTDTNSIVRTFEEDATFLRQTDPNFCILDIGIVPNMKVLPDIMIQFTETFLVGSWQNLCAREFQKDAFGRA